MLSSFKLGNLFFYITKEINEPYYNMEVKNRVFKDILYYKPYSKHSVKKIIHNLNKKYN